MSYSDLRKKYGLTSKTESKTGSTTANQSGGYAALQKKYGVSYDVDEKYLNSFISDTNSFFDSINDSSISYNDATSRLRDLSSRYDTIQGWLYQNKSRLDDESYSTLAGLKGKFSGIKKYYSQWESEDDYIKGATEASGDRQQRYEDNLKKIDELKAQRSQAASGSVYNPDSNFMMPVFDPKVRQIDDEIEALEAENLKYERGEDGYVSKAEDDHNKVTLSSDFDTRSSNRDYSNSSKEDMELYDLMNDSSSWYFDADRVYRDAYGNELALDENGNYYSPAAPQIKSEDKLALYLNTSDEERVAAAADVSGKMYGTWKSLMRTGYEGAWEYLTEQELGIYYYYLDESQESADKYLADMAVELNRRRTLDQIGQYNKAYDEANFLEKIFLNAGTIPAKFISTVTGFIEDSVDTMMGNDINPYSAAHGGMHYSQTIRGNTAEELDTTGFKIPVLDFTLGDIYQTGMSRLDSALATSVFGGGGTVFLGMGAAEEEAYRLYQQGASAEQITLDSFAAGAAEAVFEYISFGKLNEIKDVKTLNKLVKSVLIQGWNEATEESLTEVSNIVTNAIIMGGQSDLAELYKENKASAFNTFVDLVKQTAHSAFGGFIGGAGAGVVQAGRSYDATQAQYRQAGKTIMGAEGGVDALKNLANEVAGVSDAKMKNAISKQAGKVDDKTTARRVGRLYNTVNTANNLANASANQADIAKSLQRKGFNAETANDIADALVASYNGQELTTAQEKLLKSAKDSKVVQDAISNIMVNEQSTMGQRSNNIRSFERDIHRGLISKALNEAIANSTTEKQFTPQGEYAVSKDGKATAMVTEEVEGKTITKDTGEVININGIASIRKGEMLLDIGDGKTINAKNVAYANKNDALIYESIANLGDNINAETANKLIGKYKGGDALVFARGMAQAYTYGFYGIDRSELTGKRSLTTELTEEQRNFAYGLGEQYRPVKDANDKTKAIKKLAKSGKIPSERGVYYRDKDGNATDISTYLKESSIKLNDLQKTGIEAMRKMSKMMGVRFNVFESWVENGKSYYLDADGDVVEGNPNGFYDTTTGEIYIDLNAGNDYQGTMLFTIAHEVTHFMRQWSPEHFTKIAKIVFQHGGMRGNVSELVALKQAKAKAKGKPISYDVAMEEVVADGMETILKDGKVVEFMADVKKQDYAAWEKLKGWFKNLAKFLRKMVWAYSGQSAQTVEGAKVAEFSQDVLNQIERIFAEGVIESSENYHRAEIIVGQINIFLDEIMELDTVATIDSSNATPYAGELNEDEASGLKVFKEQGGAAVRPGFGRVVLGKKGVVHTAFHGNGPAKQAAFPAIKAVIENGIEIGRDINHKNRGYDTVTFAAPIDFFQTKAPLGVVVKVFENGRGDKSFYIHEICDAEGNYIELVDGVPTKKEISNTGEVDSSSTADVADNGNNPNTNIHNDSEIVKSESAEALDLEVDADTESVAPSVMNSERTWTESDYVQEREQAAKEISKAIGVSVKKAKAYIDSVNSIAKMIAEDRVRLDYFSSPGRSSFVSNVEYGGSFDFSTLCKKRRLLTGTFTAIQKALPNTALTADEILKIRNRMKEAGLEVSCGLCYVEGSRANMGQFAKEFLKLYKQYYPDAWQPNMADVNTPDGIEWVRINHPECYEQYEYFWNHYGTLKPGDKNLFASQQKPKLYQLHTEYKGEILDKFNNDENVEEKNLNGGIRLQSFSDFEIVHLIDTMQIIMDMSRVGLAGQAYTKVPDFAWALGDTGLKINLSLIAKGVDENGKLIFDDVEGMPIADAMKLRDRYSKNVGTILVAFNDEQLLAAMADDRVDYIIPFHRSQWKKSQYGAMGLPAKTKDYTYMQNEKFIKPQYHEYRGRMVQDKATNYMPNEYWDFSKSGKENAEAYLEMCARNNKRPKFYKLLQNNGDGSYSLKADGSTDGYWKLLIDFKMYDNDGNGSPQMAVKPEFNMDEAQRMLNDYQGGHSNFPVAQGVVDSFVEEYKDSHKGTLYSDRVTDQDTLDFLNEQLRNGEVTEVYRAMAVDDDGNLYPPMAGFVKVDGKKIINGQHSVIGEWEQSTESIQWDSVDEEFLIANGFKYYEKPTDDYPNGRFEKDNDIFYRNKDGKWKAKFHLYKDNGTTVDAAYAPYIHTSLSVLNDQFTSAYKRDNLVVVKGYVPNSEINGVNGKRYQANFADKPVGKTKWHSGVVAAQMPETRTVILSRYFMPIEIVDDAVFAQKTKEMMKGNDIEIPFNVITPRQRRALEAIGVRIGEARGLRDAPKKADVKYSDRILMGSLFSGGGTLEAGLAYQMLDKQFGVEYDGKIASVYADNHGDHIQVGKVEDFDISKFDDIFYLHASPVCHNFSAAKHGAKELAMDIASAKATAKHLETAMPQVFTVENAPGYRKSQSLKIITDKLTELGYKWDVDVYNSADYGSATSRNRVILRAVKDGELPAKPAKQDRTNSWDKVTRDLWDTLPKAPLRPSFISAIENTRNLPILDANGKVNVNKPLLILTTTSGHTVTYCWEGDICPTLTTKCGEARLVMPDGNIYAVTPEFMGRIQGLPDDYKYPKEKTRAFTIIGNGIPTHLTKAVVGGVLDSAYEQTHDGQVLYQDRADESVSNRSLLANAFEGLAQNEIEKNKIQEYKGKIDLINAEEKKLSDLNAQIKELSFSKGPRDTKKIRDLQFEARQAANRINTYDKQLLRLEASKPLQDVLAREKKVAYQRAEKKGKEALDKYKERAAKTQRDLLEKWQDSRKKGIDSRYRTAMRHKIKDVVNELNQYLLKGTKDRHVPESLQKAVAEALNAVNMDTVGADERIAKLKAEMMKAKTPEQIQEISRKIDHISEMGDRMNEKLKRLKDAYEDLLKSPDENTRNAYDEVIHSKLDSVIDKIGNTPLRDMTLAQLEDVYDMYRMVLTAIRDVNKSFKDAKKQSISTRANAVMAQVEEVGGKHKLSAKILNGIKKFGWNNLKPVYAFEHIGSVTLAEAFNNVRAGEDVWAVDITEARKFYLDMSKRHQYDSWDFQKQFQFQSTSGMDFSLSLEQILSLYAYSKRDQAADHLKYGGIVFDESTKIIKKKLGIPIEFNPTEATAYNISPETLSEIVSKLTDEQKAFADEMQDYLSTVMGAKGNEVSMEMYDIKLFKDKNYFPLKSAQQFMEKAREQQKGDVKIKNSGFSKETVPKAKNPIVLTPFMEVWSNHVNEMSMYHAFVLPLEDFYRIYNYKTPSKDETLATEGVNQYIQNAYGRAATAYIDQLLKDLNGGARTDSTTGFINKMMGLFKKGSVFASLSVVVQQPSAIARAAALVDTKYFIGPKVDHKRHKALWDEVKQYAPVAIIKEMGYFDTNMGKSTQDFILGKEYSGFKEKMKALVTDSNYRDEVLSKAPALADEIAWCSIWEAVKRETQAKNPGMDVKSEAFLKIAGERFTEVIVKTQVYDSVLSRSGMMRSKDTGMKMATAFMAEPTTSINMIADALLQSKRGRKKYAKTAIGAVIASQILNSILVSFVYAGRDDDEDETYLEKYIGTLTGEVLDSLNPATYIPFIKDIVSIVQGYDVERSDMAVVSDLWNAWENLSKDTVSPYRKVEGFAGSIAQIFGLPVKNIMRDARGIYQTIMSFVDGQQTTGAGIGYAVKSVLPEWMGGGDVSKQQQLYEAYLSGDSAQIARVQSRFEDQDAVNTAMRSAIKDHFESGDIDYDTAEQYLVEYGGMEDDKAYWKVEEWKYEMETGEDFQKYNDFYTAVQTGKDLKAVIKRYTDNGVEAKTLASQITSYFKPLYKEMSNTERAAIKGYLLNAYTLLGYNRNEKSKDIDKWLKD